MVLDLTSVSVEDYRAGLGLSEHGAKVLASGAKKLNAESTALLEAYLAGKRPAQTAPKEAADKSAQTPVRGSSSEKASE